MNTALHTAPAHSSSEPCAQWASCACWRSGELTLSSASMCETQQGGGTAGAQDALKGNTPGSWQPGAGSGHGAELRQGLLPCLGGHLSEVMGLQGCSACGWGLWKIVLVVRSSPGSNPGCTVLAQFLSPSVVCLLSREGGTAIVSSS